MCEWFVSDTLVNNQLGDTEIDNFFEYNGKDLIWSVTKSNIVKGSVAGSPNYKGHLCVQVNNKIYRVHNIIWAMHHGRIPDGYLVDHIDGNPSNNSIANLRLATLSQNNNNSKKRENTSSKYKGVHWNKQSNSWRASIRADGRVLYIGNFKTEEEAHKAWCAVAKDLHGEFFRAA